MRLDDYQSLKGQMTVREKTKENPHMRLDNYQDMKRYEPIDIDGSVFEFSPDRRMELESMGEIGFIEAIQRKNKLEMVPVIGGAKEAYDAYQLVNSVNAIKTGEYTQEQEEIVNNYLMDLEEERIRGVSWRGQVGRGVSELPAFMGEFMISGGLLSIGKKALVKSGKMAAEEAIKDITKKNVGKFIKRKAGEAVLRTAINPARVAEGYYERSVLDKIQFTENGIKLMNEAKESPNKTFAKTIGSLYIENFTELMGPVIGKGLSLTNRTIAKSFSKVKIPKELTVSLLKVYKKLRPNESVQKLFTEAGFNGFIEEMGEELLGKFLTALTGIEDFGADNPNNVFSRLVAAIPDSEEMLVLASIIAFPTGVKGGLNLAANMITKEKKAIGIKKPVIKELDDAQVDKLVEDFKKSQEGDKAKVKAETKTEIKAEEKPVVKEVEEKSESVLEVKTEPKVESKEEKQPEGKFVKDKDGSETFVQDKKKMSLHYEKLRKELGLDGEGIEIDVMSLENERNKAISYAINYPEKAMRVAFGMEEAPKTVNQNAIRIAVMTALIEQGKKDQADMIGRMLSQSFTKTAKELNIAKLNLDSSLQIKYNIAKERLTKLGKGVLEVGEKVIQQKAKEGARQVKKNTAKPTIQDIDKLINGIIC
jgi:hypothetical protein